MNGLIKRPNLPGPAPFIHSRKPPLELCDETCEALAALLATIVEREKKGAHVMGPRGRVAVFAEINRRKMFPHLRRRLNGRR